MNEYSIVSNLENEARGEMNGGGGVLFLLWEWHWWWSSLALENDNTVVKRLESEYHHNHLFTSQNEITPFFSSWT